MASNSVLNDSEMQIFMNQSMKNRIIDRLNQFSRTICRKELSNDEKIKILEENNQLIAEIGKLSVRKSDAKTEPKLDHHQSIQKMKNDAQWIKDKIGIFNPQKHDMFSWFSEYDDLCNQMRWTIKQRRDNLIHFIDSGLLKIVQSILDYDQIKFALNDFTKLALFERNISFKEKMRSYGFNIKEQEYWDKLGVS